jgi:hypothetical protein
LKISSACSSGSAWPFRESGVQPTVNSRQYFEYSTELGRPTLLEKVVKTQEYLRELLGTSSTTPVLLDQKSKAAREAVFLVVRNAYFRSDIDKRQSENESYSSPDGGNPIPN